MAATPLSRSGRRSKTRTRTPHLLGPLAHILLLWKRGRLLNSSSSSSSSKRKLKLQRSRSCRDPNSSSSTPKRKLQWSSSSLLLLSPRDRDRDSNRTPCNSENEAGTGGLHSDLLDPDSWKLGGDSEDVISSDWDLSDSDSSEFESCSYPYAPEDELHRGSPKWPCEANCKSFHEYMRQYWDIVIKSEGFTSFFDPTSMGIEGGISPCTLNEYVQEAANFAVQEHNKKGANVITLKKIVKANREVQSGSNYYLTLEAAEGDKTVYYETKVKCGLNLKPQDYVVKIFRPAKHYTPVGLAT